MVQHSSTDRIASRPRATGNGPTSKEPNARSSQQAPCIVLLTRDADLGASIRQAVDASRVDIVDSVDRAEALASARRCAIFITDESLTQRACAALGERLRRHEPAMVMIAVGDRGQDNALIGLLSAGVADRLMLKPVTPALSKIVVESAAREYRSRSARIVVERRTAPAAKSVECDETAMTQPVRVRTASEPAPPIEPPLSTPKRVEVAAAVADRPRAARHAPMWLAACMALLAGGAAWWILRPGAVPARVDTPVTTHPGDRILVDAERSIAESRFVDAITALQGARRAGVAEDRIAPLEARLRNALEAKLTKVEISDGNNSVQASASIGAVEDTERRQPTSTARVQTPVPPAAEPQTFSSRGERIDPTNEVPPPSAVVPQPEVRSGLEVGEAELASPSMVNATHGVDERIGDSQSRELGSEDEVRSERESSFQVSAQRPTMSDRQQLPPAAVAAAEDVQPTAERRIRRMVEPEYPSEAQMRGIEGWTDLSFLISSDGDVVDPRVEDSSRKQLFARPALHAVRQWKYEPASVSGSTPDRVRIRVEFRAPN